MTQNKNGKVIFWVFTIPVVAMMLSSGAALLGRFPQNVEGMMHLGYPLYFLNILGTAKILGSIALLYRRFRTLSEWAYAGFTFEFLSASYSHFSSGDGAAKALLPIAVLALLAGSYRYWKKGCV